MVYPCAGVGVGFAFAIAAAAGAAAEEDFISWDVSAQPAAVSAAAHNPIITIALRIEASLQCVRKIDHA